MSLKNSEQRLLEIKNKTLRSVVVVLLQQLGNNKPNPKQVDLLESLLSKVAFEYKTFFDYQLTDREIGCLYLAARGKTISETAGLLGIMPSTVKFYRKEIKKKLCCSTMAQAVYEGVQYQYLAPRYGLD